MISNSKFLQSIEISTKLATIKRTTGYRKRHRENDVEHSYQLALVAWIANHEYKLNLNDGKILKIALVHDLVEIYSGDIDAFSDKKKQKKKKETELAALQQLKHEYAGLKEIADAIEEYEKKESLESKFVNIVDKLIPERHIHENNKDYYIKRKITFTKYVEWLYKKVDYKNLPGNFIVIIDKTVNELEEKYKHFYYSAKT